MTIDPKSYDTICKLVRDRAAIVLEEGKEYLVQSRLRPVLEEGGYESYERLAADLAKGAHGLVAKVVEALTTNETSFFRDGRPFDVMRNAVLPALVRSRHSERRLRVWCGASSTGQEPLSLAILLLEAFPELRGWDVSILATDINSKMVARCKAGEYTDMEVARGLDPLLKTRYFNRHGTAWLAKPELMDWMRYEQRNLIDPIAEREFFDVVFMRNVLIYFDVATKKTIVEGVHRALRPDGAMFLGAAESLAGVTDVFETDRGAHGTVYRPRTAE